MEDKVISEFKVVETEDGYRIEIKGDKEKLKKMFEHGPMGFARGRHFRHHRGFGPFWWFRHGPWGHGPWGWDEEDEEAEGDHASEARV
jgi:hypothetical protein